ncbi:HupE / UreJ protein [Flavobacterium cyanobacteriorum]|uniref:HupE / UreJ protein n=1 Tax=Flavobacterium cyanobacteriorum TaxID=2022802 RepID=A0A255ZKT7_9FLAO|nr:HupE/UreJ family protein [Flavobacterium cyanobacteriorum]OYQ42009.1 HupE / UreJ protein [Flavobacterium cyanobacteriorum]
MSDFWLYFNIGLRHVLDINGYDHMLFLTALTVPYAFRQWRILLLLLTLFTIGHTMSLILSVYGIISIKPVIIEFLILVTILFAALYNFAKAGKSYKEENISVLAIGTLFFGIIHGLGFSNFFKNMIMAGNESKLLPLLEFALGIEAAQIIVVIAILILSWVIQNFFRVSRRDWVLVISAFISGVIVPMIAYSPIWSSTK